MIQGMNQTVEGMGSAFYTTFFGGLLGGVLLRMLYLENYRSVTALLSDCEQLSARWIMPLSRRAGRLTSGEVDEALADVQRTLKQFSNEVEAVSGSVAQGRAAIEGQLQVVFADARESFAKLMASELEALAEGIRAMGRVLAEQQEPLRASLEASQRSMAELVAGQLAQLSSGLQGLVDTLEAGKAPLGAELEQLGSLVQASVERVEATVALARRVEQQQRGQQTRELAERLQQAAALLQEFSVVGGDSDEGTDGEAA